MTNIPSAIGGTSSFWESGTVREKGSAVALGGQGIFRFIFFFCSACAPGEGAEGKMNFIYGSTGTVVDPNGPLMSRDDSVRDKEMLGGRGTGVAPGYDCLAGVVQNRRLHVDNVRRVATLIFSSTKRERGKVGGQRNQLLTSQPTSTNSRENRKEERMSLCPPYAPFFGFAGVAASVSPLLSRNTVDVFCSFGLE